MKNKHSKARRRKEHLKKGLRVRRGAPLSSERAKRLHPFIREIVLSRPDLSARKAAEELVAKAIPRTSPIHADFEWNDSKLAHESRLKTAMDYIGSFQVVIEGVEEPVREFPIVNVDGARSYRLMKDVLTSEEWMQQLIDEAKREADLWASKYRVLEKVAEVSGVFKAIEELKRQ